MKKATKSPAQIPLQRYQAVLLSLAAATADISAALKRLALAKPARLRPRQFRGYARKASTTRKGAAR